MNQNYRNYCRRMGEAMILRHIFPRSTLNDDELIRICQTARTTDLDALRQTAVKMFPERFQTDDFSQEQAQGEECLTFGGMVQSC